MLINTGHIAFDIIPMDVLPIILGNLSLETDIVALVCKTWKECVDSENFRESIRPTRVMGIKQWIKQNPNIIFEGKEHRLPRKFYKEYATKGGLCFFNPVRVKLKIADKEHKSVVLNNLKVIASLFPNPNLKTMFTTDSWEDALNAVREEEAPHWVWEEANIKGIGKDYAGQQEMVKKEDKKRYPERYQTTADNTVVVGSKDKPKASEPKQIVILSNAEDHVLCKFMAEAILGERDVTWDPNSGKFRLVRVKSALKCGDAERPTAVTLSASGFTVINCHGCVSTHIGFVYARKSFGV